MEFENENGICPSCGYPAHAGHGPGCQAAAPESQGATAVESGREEEPATPELVPAREGFVEKETGYRLKAGSFTADSPLLEGLTPIVTAAEGGADLTDGLEIKEAPSMGKAAFVERETVLDGVKYNFIQWKGVGRNHINRGLPETIRQVGGQLSYPLGEGQAVPLFFLRAKGRVMLRFQGGAFYEDLLTEAQQARKFEGYGLRMPKIVETMKFSQEFCRDNDLPLPANDEPGDFRGQGLADYLEAHAGQIDGRLLEEMREAGEFHTGYGSAVLGENVRAFRNIWRVDDVEKAMATEDAAERRQRLGVILETSRRVLSKELGRELDDAAFIEAYVKLLGRQAATLVDNRLNQGAFVDHKQDVTLAAEICDFDGAHQLDEEFFRANRPAWVKDAAGMEEWRAGQESLVDRQVMLLAAHFKPVVDAAAALGGGRADYARPVESYVDAFVAGLSAEQRTRLKGILETGGDLGSVAAIAGEDAMRQENFAGCQPIFEAVADQLREKL